MSSIYPLYSGSIPSSSSSNTPTASIIDVWIANKNRPMTIREPENVFVDAWRCIMPYVYKKCREVLAENLLWVTMRHRAPWHIADVTVPLMPAVLVHVRRETTGLFDAVKNAILELLDKYPQPPIRPIFIVQEDGSHSLPVTKPKLHLEMIAVCDDNSQARKVEIVKRPDSCNFEVPHVAEKFLSGRLAIRLRPTPLISPRTSSRQAAIGVAQSVSSLDNVHKVKPNAAVEERLDRTICITNA